MNKAIRIILFFVLILSGISFYSCYDEFKGPAGYGNYYFNNQSNQNVFLKYLPVDGDTQLTSIIFADSMVMFHSDKMTEENPSPSKSFQLLQVYIKGDSIDVLSMELKPVVDSVWTEENVTEFSIGEKNWVLDYP